jgi:hypothetical protein
MPEDRDARWAADENVLQDHLAGAESALRQVARAAESDGQRKAATLHADVVARIRRDFRGRPLSEGAVSSKELVDALLAGTDALRSQADGERQVAARTREDVRRRAERESRAAEFDHQADLILELDRDIEL